MNQLTIFTPTYNRAYCLHHCYESLRRQTNQAFTWLIIDDGSTDGTKEMVSNWIRESNIEIEYVWQENQGMHGAHNTAYEQIQTELNVCIDSDDYMPDDAVEKILSCWNEHGNEQMSGLIGLDSDQHGQVIGTELPVHLKTSTLFDLYSRHGVTGDKKIVYRTALTREYPYPVFSNEKYVGLAYKYYQLDKAYQLLLMNEVICRVEYLPDGSSRNMISQYHRNPRGFSFYRIELMKLPFGSVAFKFRQAIHYVSSSILSRNWRLFNDTPKKRLTALALPFGITLYCYIKIRLISRRMMG